MDCVAPRRRRFRRTDGVSRKSADHVTPDSTRSHGTALDQCRCTQSAAVGAFATRGSRVRVPSAPHLVRGGFGPVLGSGSGSESAESQQQSPLLAGWARFARRRSARVQRYPVLVEAQREEMHRLVDGLSPEQLPNALAELRVRSQRPRPTVWPPSWFGAGTASSSDVSERVDEILREGLGRRPA